MDDIFLFSVLLALDKYCDKSLSTMKVDFKAKDGMGGFMDVTQLTSRKKR